MRGTDLAWPDITTVLILDQQEEKIDASFIA
jgi:hypothetical protein